MKINGLIEKNTQAGTNGTIQATDSVSKNIQNQIANAQKRSQELSSNEEMPMEEKMKKRQEIQQEITSLQQQLRQHQMDQRKEKQEKASSAQNTTKEAKSGQMEAVITADSSLKQAKTQASVATKMEGTARVLASEIKLDAAIGTNTEKKEEALDKIQRKAQEATASQLNTLKEVGENITVDISAEGMQKYRKSIENENDPMDRTELRKYDEYLSKSEMDPTH